MNKVNLNMLNISADSDSSSVPLVSVVIMAYKRINLLRFTIDSVLAQTLSDFELIITDDSNSPEILQMCHDINDVRIKYFGNSTCLGMLENAKSGMRKARGKYIANIHDDDVIEPLFLEKLVQPMEADDAIGLVFCDHTIMDKNGVVDLSASANNSRSWGREAFPEGVIRMRSDALFSGVIPVPSARLFRANTIDIEGIPDEVGVIYDWWMAFLHCTSDYTCYYVPLRLMHYRVHEDSATSAGNPKYGEGMAFILSYFMSNNLFPEKSSIIKKRLVNTTINGTKFRLLYGENDKARENLWRAFRLTGDLRCGAAYLLAWLPSVITRRFFVLLTHLPIRRSTRIGADGS